LAKAIRRWAAPNEPPPDPPVPVFRPDRLLKSLGGDDSALRRLVTIYLETTPPLLAKLREALVQKDVTAFVHAAHTLKGSLTQLEASSAAAQAGLLETQGRSGSLEDATVDAQVTQLEQKVADLQQTVGRWLKSK